MFEIVAHGDLERMLPAPMEIARSAARGVGPLVPFWGCRQALLLRRWEHSYYFEVAPLRMVTRAHRVPDEALDARIARNTLPDR
jgi:hypothetical protein